jgi:predicted RNA-binding Zn-ribbon protein involved in translation (DUF1610 family)
MENKMDVQLSNAKIEEYHRLSSLLSGVQAFVEKHPTLTYLEFDYYVVHDLTLFSIDPNFNFLQVEETLKLLLDNLGPIKRIFAKPIIILRDSDDVLPVENVRTINQNTLLHLANHTQNVTNISKRKVKPRKLLTRVYEDDYSIYENLVFCNFIDEILFYVRRNRKTLNNLLYAGSILEFNLLEKANHINYFLALGKLHTGYIRDYSQYLNLSKRLLDELSTISHAIQPRLKRPVYQKNRIRNKKLSLKKTNIFLAQKDYRRVFRTYKQLINVRPKQLKNIDIVNFDELIKNYLLYIQILTIFSAMHLNFGLDENSKMNLKALDITLTFKGWSLNILNRLNKEVMLTFTKDCAYKILIVPNIIDQSKVDITTGEDEPDEIVVASQEEKNYASRNDVYLSVDDIDSFRRLQQIILRGMIYADTSRDTCPFCGGKLQKRGALSQYECPDCMTQIKEKTCDKNGKKYFLTDIAHLRKSTINRRDFSLDEEWEYNRAIESSMFFRNITRLNNKMDFICPYCQETDSQED